ncbi:MAG: alkylation response protein AidB-like acyl-CoA dehydrogenase [Candidatus Azotimanducaceae bacterium]|jgi:alkylation response protein AidB-like acyl-CoA dehydrogenase
MTATELDQFRKETKSWIAENFPGSIAGSAMGLEGDADQSTKADFELWRSRLADKGWGAPTWPKEYGGAGLSHAEAKVVGQEMGKQSAFNPIPMLAGMGVTMVGPTVLEYGTDAQKEKHLRGMASGEIKWCLGLSEPGAGSDLASLRARAEDDGDTFKINGQKTWTSGADISQWCGALVRTDPDAKKRNGISFVMLPMDQEGVTTKPIQLISGISPFCETFLDDARAEKSDLLGPLNEGWSVVKRLLQHERQSQTQARAPGAGGSKPTIADIAKGYVGTDETGALSDGDLRQRLVNHMMDSDAHSLTVNRITAEARGKVEVSAAASILKNSATKLAQDKAELTLEMMGSQGLGWDGDHYTADEKETVRDWLWGKAISIYGGSYEVQNNIISKNILGLPENTQKG